MGHCRKLNKLDESSVFAASAQLYCRPHKFVLPGTCWIPIAWWKMWTIQEGKRTTDKDVRWLTRVNTSNLVSPVNIVWTECWENNAVEWYVKALVQIHFKFWFLHLRQLRRRMLNSASTKACAWNGPPGPMCHWFTVSLTLTHWYVKSKERGLRF